MSKITHVHMQSIRISQNDKIRSLGPYRLNSVVEGDCFELGGALPDESIDIIVTSPPYWGQRTSLGNGCEEDPRAYLAALIRIFSMFQKKLKPEGILWINLGDAFNTPVNWREEDRNYSTLGPDRKGLSASNSAYVKPRARRRAFIDRSTGWLQYGNLLALPHRLVIALCEEGYLFRGEVIWHKRNPMPEGKCRRPHRQHEGIFLLAKQDQHAFRTSPPVKTVWEFANEKIDGKAHYSRFPEDLPRRCIDAYGIAGPDVVVLDPFSGSGTSGIAALKLGCSYIGFEIDHEQVVASNKRLRDADRASLQLFSSDGVSTLSK
jgi:DNA modification methylase